MRVAKYIVFSLICLVPCRQVFGQHKNSVPATVHGIFDDLPIDDPAANSVLRPGEDSVQKIKDNLFLTGTISKTRCFLGEPILLTYTLYSALQSTSRVDRAPSFAGFSVEDMETDNERVIRKKQNGRNYRIFTIQQAQLTPLQEGVLTIEPISVSNTISYTENKKEAHYSGSTEAKAITIRVDSLPLAGRPADFTGATGNFTLHARADSLVAAGENNTLHITVAGTGNFTAVSLPGIKWPTDCEHFTVTTRQQINKNAFPPTGEKTFDIPFVAAKEGMLVIPALRLAFFDTGKKIYRFANAGPLTIQISPAPAKPLPGLVTVPVKKEFPYYILLMVIPLLLLWGLARYRGKRKPAVLQEEPPPTTVEVTIEPAIEIQLEALSAFSDTREYISAFKKLLSEHLCRHAGLVAGTEMSILQQVASKEPRLAAAVEQLYNQCNKLLYAPAGMDTVTRRQMEDDLVALSLKMKKLVG
ncbi:MAG: hypothetical protein ABI813_15165 [Bacteroidota bacterium]